MLEPVRAIVRPRVRSPLSDEALPLDDEIISLLERGTTGIVWLVGGPGSGKTTALSHLAAVLPPSGNVMLCDTEALRPPEPDKLFIGCGDEKVIPRNALVYRLVPWGEDEIIEYLLGAHRDRCHSVMRRCAENRQLLRGNPELWRHVLDILAADGSIATVREGLRRLIETQFPSGPDRRPVANALLTVLAGAAELRARYGYGFDPGWQTTPWHRLLSLEPIPSLLAAERLAELLRAEEPCPFLGHRLPRDLVQETAALIGDDLQALERLKSVLAASDQPPQPMAASLLHAARVGWRPSPKTFPASWPFRRQRIVVPRLTGAFLDGAAWPGVSLSGLDLRQADLNAADLSEANLDDSDATSANLSCAKLAGASLLRWRAPHACLGRADLSYVRATQAEFQWVDAREACFEGALLTGAAFHGAQLNAARFVRANMDTADLLGAQINGADFSYAELRGARLTGLVLRVADFRQCSFRQAVLQKCDLEGMNLPGADFGEANLRGALLTGTSMPGANFYKAILVKAGLADVDWENADLRLADLRGVSFHMGSSRSGLVASSIASLGTRTGFYTDEYNEQDFRAPEEIRKANLRGADLRGAQVEGADFYLVDLRDARYHPHQERHFRSCGAILESRVRGD
ncbi:MAG: pentapeptide repeat-containing protein [Planctomycetota bacterium]